MTKDETIIERFSGGFFHALNPFEIPDELFATIIVGCLILGGLTLAYLVSQGEKARDEEFIDRAERLGYKRIDDPAPSTDQ